MTIRCIIFGATGMVGEGVLHEALAHAAVESVLVIGRRSCGVSHPKLTEIIHDNFFDFTALEPRLTGYDACYFCLGVSSLGMSEADYTRTTYDITMATARTLVRLNPGMTFCYVSGTGTDSTETGRLMWARVKGKTENDLTRLSFRQVFNFRPGFIKPIPGTHNAPGIARAVGAFYPLLNLFLSRYICTLEDLGRAMIEVTLHGYGRQILECQDITAVGATSRKRT